MHLTRRFLVAGPLAAFVTLLAHAVLFGHAHAVAGAHESGLLGSLGIALGLLFLGAVVSSALDPASGHAGRPVRTATRLALGLDLAFGGACGLAATEIAEGRGLGVLTSGAILVVVPVALLVAAFAFVASRWARRLGSALGVGQRSAFECVVRIVAVSRPLAPVLIAAAPRRGRAPPR